MIPAGDVKVILKTTPHAITPRPITTQDIGLRGGCARQAEVLFELWKLLSRDYDMGSIAEATNLEPTFIANMMELFEG